MPKLSRLFAVFVALHFIPSSSSAIVLSPGDILAAIFRGGIVVLDPVTGEDKDGLSLGSPPSIATSAVVLAIDTQGHLIAGDYGGSLYRVDPVTLQQTVIATGFHFFYLWHQIAVDETGGILVAKPASGPSSNPQPGKVLRIDPTTGEQETLASHPDISDALALSASGTIFVRGRAGLYRLDRLTNQLDLVSTRQFSSFAVDKDENVYGIYDDRSASELVRLVRLNVPTGMESELTAFEFDFYPMAIAIDVTGALIVGTFGPRPCASCSRSNRLFRVDSVTGNRALISDFGNGSEFYFSSIVVVPGDIPDGDSDGVVDLYDNCLDLPNPDQSDMDRNRVGDACNDASDRDADEWEDSLDNCIEQSNPNQLDMDGDALGNVCDPYPNDTFNLQCLDDLDTAFSQRGQLEFALSQSQAQVLHYANELGQCTDSVGALESQLSETQQSLAQTQVELTEATARVAQLESELGGVQAALSETNDQLTTTLADLAEAVADRDSDGVRDTSDACPGTATDAVVDPVGCSLDQFCAGIDVSVGSGRSTCNNADWRNDEPVNDPLDCKAGKDECLAR